MLRAISESKGRIWEALICNSQEEVHKNKEYNTVRRHTPT